MNSYVAVGIVLIVLTPWVLRMLFRRRGKAGPVDYRVVPALFSTDERELFAVLHQIFGDRYAIFGRIRIGELVQQRRERNRREWSGDVGEMAEHSFSFVLCSPSDLSVVAAIDVRNARRELPRDKVNESRVKDLCAAAGLALIHVAAAQLADRERLKEFLEHALRRPTLPLPIGDGRTEPHISGLDGLKLDE